MQGTVDGRFWEGWLSQPSYESRRQQRRAAYARLIAGVLVSRCPYCSPSLAKSSGVSTMPSISTPFR